MLLLKNFIVMALFEIRLFTGPSHLCKLPDLQESESQSMENRQSIEPVGIDEEFEFSCGRQVSCFNACCRDLNQFLTPYDVLRLARHLGMTTGDFLQVYTVHYTGPETGLPVVSLRPADYRDKLCPFVTPDGCRVYENRPGSCRMYPLARMLKRSRQTGALTEAYALICEPHCHGFEQAARRTVRQWVADQGLLPYNKANDSMIEVISVKQQAMAGPLGKEAGLKIFMALYDLDAFRDCFAGGIEADCFKMGLEPQGLLVEDDEMLLGFAMKYAAAVLRHLSGFKEK